MLCIPKEIIDKIKTDLRITGAVKLNEMTVSEMSSIFGKYMDRQNSIEWAKSFKLAMASQKNGAVKRWINSHLKETNIKPKDIDQALQDRQQAIRDEAQALLELENSKKLEQKRKATEQKRDLIKEQQALEKQRKIEEQIIEKQRKADDKYQADLLAGKHTGFEVKPEEVEVIFRLTKELEQAKNEETTNLSGYSDSYFNKRAEIDAYLDQINEMSWFDKATKVWGRGAMLASLASPIFNIASNTTGYVSEAITRNISIPLSSNLEAKKKFLMVAKNFTPKNKAIKGQIDSYVKECENIYKRTGIDMTRAILLSDSGQTVMGEHFQQVIKKEWKGANPLETITNTGNNMTYYMQQGIFKWTQGYPDIKFASRSFANSVAVQASKIADMEGYSGDEHTARQKELMDKVFNFKTVENKADPDLETVIGIRELAVFQAKKATGQDDGRAITQWLLQTRNKFDMAIPYVNIGVLLDPFLKTPVNVKITSAFNYSPIGFVQGFITYMQTRNVDGLTELQKQKNVELIWGQLVRAGLGTLVLAILGSLIGDDEYINDFDTASKSDKMLGGAYNSIIIGNQSISTDLLGFYQFPVQLMMAVRKAKDTQKLKATSDTLQSYVASFPVLDNFFNFFKDDKYPKSDEEKLKEYGQTFLSGLWSRTIPSIINQTVAVADGVDRNTDYGSYWASIEKNIPFLRDDLTIKQGVLGDPVTIPAWRLLTGARVKTIDNRPEAKELKDVMNNINVTTTYTGYQDYKSLLNLVNKGEITQAEFAEFMFKLNAEFGDNMMRKMDSREYSMIKPEDYEKKKNLILEDKTTVFDNTLKKMGLYTRTKKESDTVKKEKKK